MRLSTLFLALALGPLGCEARAIRSAPWSPDAWVLLIAGGPAEPQITLHAPEEAVIVPVDAQWAEIAEYPNLSAPAGADPKTCGVRMGSAGASLPPAQTVWVLDRETGELNPIPELSTPVSWGCADNPCRKLQVEQIPFNPPSQPRDVAAVSRTTAYVAGRRLEGTEAPMIARIDGSSFEVLPPSQSAAQRIESLTWNHSDQLWGIGTDPVDHVVRFDMEGQALELELIDVGGDVGADADASPDGAVMLSGTKRLLLYSASSTVGEDIAIEAPRRVAIAAADRAFVLDSNQGIWVWDGRQWVREVDRGSFLFELSLEDIDASESRVVAMDHFGSMIERKDAGWERLSDDLPPLPGRYEAVALMRDVVLLAASRGLVARLGDQWCVVQDGWSHVAIDAQADVAYSLARDPADSSWKVVRVMSSDL